MKKLLYTLLVLVLIIAPYAYYQNAKADIYGSSLVGWWTFDSNDISGTTVTDNSGTGNTGTTVNSPKAAVGKLGQALSFDGSTQDITLSSVTGMSVPNGSSAISLCAWIKVNTSLGFTTGVILSLRGAGGTPIVNMVYADNGAGSSPHKLNTLFRTDAGGFSHLNSNTSIDDGAWHHVCTVFNQPSIAYTIYIDGKFDTSTSFTGTGSVTVDAADSGIAFDPLNGSIGKFPGTIDDPRVYSRALSAAEVAQLYNLGQPKHRSVF